MASALSLNHVSKRFGDFVAVNDVSLDIPKGSVYGFLGPNGAGKTTIIRMVLDILKPGSGEISVLGHASALDVRNRIGYLPEEKGLYKKMKVWRIVRYFSMLKGLDGKTAGARAWELLGKYGLKEFGNAAVESLSKGMAQKVQVLAAVAHRPELVILDEPFSGLDPVNQAVLEELIRDMADNGQTVIFSTHVMQHAERLCDRLLLIARGSKIFDGTLDQARATIPRRVIVESNSDLGPLTTIPGVLAVTAIETGGETDNIPGQWQIQISAQLDPQQILQACFHNNIALNRFEFSEPSLHDVFVHLVGADMTSRKRGNATEAARP